MIRDWWNQRDGNGLRRGKAIADFGAIWGMLLLCFLAFLGFCYVISAAKRGHW